MTKELHSSPRVLDACRTAMNRLGGAHVSALGVTSTLRGEGRTTVALAMAHIQHTDFARTTLLVEMDLENPVLAGLLNLAPWPGVAEAVAAAATTRQIIQPVTEAFGVVTAGSVGNNPARTMAEMVSGGLIAELGQHADVVIADLPPALASSFGRLAAEPFQQLLLVVRAEITPVHRIEEAIDFLPSKPGVLLNGTRTRLPTWVANLVGG